MDLFFFSHPTDLCVLIEYMELPNEQKLKTDLVLISFKVETPPFKIQTLPPNYFNCCRATEGTLNGIGTIRAAQGTEQFATSLVLELQQRAARLHHNEVVNQVRVMFRYFYQAADFYGRSREGVNKRLPPVQRLNHFMGHILKDAGIIRSERLIMSHDGSVKVLGPKSGVEIEITPYVKDHHRKAVRYGL